MEAWSFPGPSGRGASPPTTGRLQTIPCLRDLPIRWKRQSLFPGAPTVMGRQDSREWELIHTGRNQSQPTLTAEPAQGSPYLPMPSSGYSSRCHSLPGLWDPLLLPLSDLPSHKVSGALCTLWQVIPSPCSSVFPWIKRGHQIILKVFQPSKDILCLVSPFPDSSHSFSLPASSPVCSLSSFHVHPLPAKPP